jgi:hypothetical protein
MTGKKTRLIVDAQNPAFRIDVIGADYAVRAKGYGRIEQDLPTGYYTVRYAAGDAVEERDIVLRPDKPLTLDQPPDLFFTSAAPMELTSTSHEYHQSYAQELSKFEALERGEGGELFIFVRDVDAGGKKNPAKGLSLHRLDGERILWLAQVAEVSEREDLARWAGRNIILDPGTYRLRLSLGRDQAVEIAVVVCPYWQSQIFLLRQGGETKVGTRPIVDLMSAMQIMGHPGQGFDPWRVIHGQVDPIVAGEDMRLAELARQALAYDRQGIHTDDLQDMLQGKWEDPLLGIFGVHLLLMRPDPDLGIAGLVVNRLQNDLLSGFRHPDVEILAVEIARRRGNPIKIPPIAAPPMLRRSWQMLVQATAEQPALIPPRSLNAQISDRLWGAGAWLAWQVPETPRPSKRKAKRSRRPKGYAMFEPDMLKSLRHAAMLDVGAEMPEPAMEESPAEETADIEVEELLAKAKVTYSDLETELTNILDSETLQVWDDESPLPPPDQPAERFLDLTFAAVREKLEAFIPDIESMLDAIDLEELAYSTELDSNEFALLVHIISIPTMQRRAKETPIQDPLSLEALVSRLGLPAMQVLNAMMGLVGKIQEQV